MDFKALVKTKTFWLGVLAVFGGVIEGVFDGWAQAWEKILLGFAIITGRQAVAKVEQKL